MTLTHDVVLVDDERLTVVVGDESDDACERVWERRGVVTQDERREKVTGSRVEAGWRSVNARWECSNGKVRGVVVVAGGPTGVEK